MRDATRQSTLWQEGADDNGVLLRTSRHHSVYNPPVSLNAAMKSVHVRKTRFTSALMGSMGVDPESAAFFLVGDNARGDSSAPPPSAAGDADVDARGANDARGRGSGSSAVRVPDGFVVGDLVP